MPAAAVATPPVFLNRPQAAQQLNICLRQLDARIKQGSIPCRRFGRRVLIPRLAIERLACDCAAAKDNS